MLVNTFNTSKEWLGEIRMRKAILNSPINFSGLDFHDRISIILEIVFRNKFIKMPFLYM